MVCMVSKGTLDVEPWLEGSELKFLWPLIFGLVSLLSFAKLWLQLNEIASLDSIVNIDMNMSELEMSQNPRKCFRANDIILTYNQPSPTCTESSLSE